MGAVAATVRKLWVWNRGDVIENVGRWERRGDRQQKTDRGRAEGLSELFTYPILECVVHDAGKKVRVVVGFNDGLRKVKGRRKWGRCGKRCCSRPSGAVVGLGGGHRRVGLSCRRLYKGDGVEVEVERKCAGGVACARCGSGVARAILSCATALARP